MEKREGFSDLRTYYIKPVGNPKSMFGFFLIGPNWSFCALSASIFLKIPQAGFLETQSQGPFPSFSLSDPKNPAFDLETHFPALRSVKIYFLKGWPHESKDLLM